MCFGEEIHEIHEIQGERWMRVDAATHACWAHIRPMTITCCTCCFKDALSNFQVLNDSQCGDVQICFMFMQICPNKSFVERSSCLLFPFFFESKPPTRFGCFHEQDGELILTLSAYLVLCGYL